MDGPRAIMDSMIGRRDRPILISAPRVEPHGQVMRVTAAVDGAPLWFESADVRLGPSIEAFASTLLLMSQHVGRTLVLEGEVSETWRNNVADLLPIWQRWWGYKIKQPVCDTRRDSSPPRNGTALMFSGGVDSFYSLLEGPHPDFLVSVHGFDVELGDRERASALEEALRDAANEQGCTPILIRTNCREHPAAGKSRLWERAHGGALAGIGHLLSDRISRLVVSSSYSNPVKSSWGSTPQTDSLFSSDGFTVTHFGGDWQREDRVGAIAGNPLVRKHLRVCWENKAPVGNCSRCEKCVITMMHLAEHGALDEFDRFDSMSVLADRIEKLPLVHRELKVMSRIAARGLLEKRAAKALDTLLRRSRRATPLFSMRSRFQTMIDRHLNLETI